jgi:hypothetical protein
VDGTRTRDPRRDRPREAIQRVAEKPLEQGRHLVDELERVTGMPIADLAPESTEDWNVARRPPEG